MYIISNHSQIYIINYLLDSQFVMDKCPIRIFRYRIGGDNDYTEQCVFWQNFILNKVVEKLQKNTDYKNRKDFVEQLTKEILEFALGMH